MTIMTLSEAAKLDKRKHPRMYAEHGFELDPVIYRTRQWSVTEFGLENHVALTDHPESTRVRSVSRKVGA